MGWDGVGWEEKGSAPGPIDRAILAFCDPKPTDRSFFFLEFFFSSFFATNNLNTPQIYFLPLPHTKYYIPAYLDPKNKNNKIKKKGTSSLQVGDCIYLSCIDDGLGGS